MLKLILFVCLAIPWLAGNTAAEESGTLAIGSRVRVTSPEVGVWSLVGRVVAMESGFLVVAGEDDGPQTRVPIAPSTVLEVSGGKKSQAGRGAMIGAGIGAMSGVLMTTGDYNSDEGNSKAVSIVGAAAGAAIGGLVGLAFKSESWLPANVPEVTVGIAPLPRGVSISFGVAWGRSRR